MSGFVSTDEILRRAQKYIAFEFIFFPIFHKNLSFVGQENIIFILKFRDEDASRAFEKFHRAIGFSDEAIQIIDTETRRRLTKISDWCRDKNYSLDDVMPVFAKDAREFFHIKNIKKLTDEIQSVQTPFLRKGRVKPEVPVNRDDEAL